MAAAIAAAADAINIAAAEAAADAIPILAPAIEPPPSYEMDYETATVAIGQLPSLHPRPSHANIRALERVLFERLETLQSTQSEEWGFRGLAEQPAEYALKSVIPWIDAPNPGTHRELGLNAMDTRDAEVVFQSMKTAYLAQTTVTRAIIAALNIAVPKAFKRSTTAAGGALIGAAAYRSNHAPRSILLALRTVYGIPSPAERNANDALFSAPWNTAEPIETFFDRLEDCYVAAIIASPPYTMEQMMTRAIMAIQITGLYSQALIEWNGTPAAARTWDALKLHFTTAYIIREQSGTGTTGSNGYHTAATAVEHDDTLTNIEATFTQELGNIQSANNAHHQAAVNSMADLRSQITAAQQQIAMLTLQFAPTANGANVPRPGAPAPVAQGPARAPYRGGRNNRTRGGRPYTTQPTTPPLPGGTTGIPPAPLQQNNNRGRQPPNPNKWYNNQNYCFSCGYDVPIWHTSATCNDRKPNHQVGCDRGNVAEYKALGHAVSERGIFRTIMPTAPTADQA